MLRSLAALLALAPVLGRTIAVPGDEPDLAAAVAAAEPGDTIVLPAGVHAGDLTVTEPLVVVGAGADQTTIRGGERGLTVESRLELKGLAVTAERTALYLAAGSHARLETVAIRDADEDGIGFDDSPATVLEMRDCLVAGCTDGVDLESTQGLLVGCEFIGNRDDGLDYDGDAAVTCLDCTFADNRDDGVEIRIATWTQAVFADCVFRGNGEDGLEIINTERDEPQNVLIVGRNRFEGNGRYGVGFVHATEEEARDDDRSRCVVLWGPNAFAANGAGDVSANHRIEMSRALPTAETVRIEVLRGEHRAAVTVPLHAPAPVGTIGMQPAVNGARARDLEGIAVDERYVYLADDDAPGIHIVDRRTSAVVRTVPTNPLPTGREADGPEGLSIDADADGGRRLWLSADDGDRLFSLRLGEDGPGGILSEEDTVPFADYPEGFERFAGRSYVAYGSHFLTCVDDARQARQGFPVRYEPEGYGAHLAGIGHDDRRLYVTLSAYTGDKKHSEVGLLLAVDPDTGDPLEAWQISYCDDPRGVAVDGGIAWVADGMSPYADAELGVNVRPGIRVVLFALGDPRLVHWSSLPGRLLER